MKINLKNQAGEAREWNSWGVHGIVLEWAGGAEALSLFWQFIPSVLPGLSRCLASS